jgi:hypothetical protein
MTLTEIITQPVPDVQTQLLDLQLTAQDLMTRISAHAGKLDECEAWKELINVLNVNLQP